MGRLNEAGLDGGVKAGIAAEIDMVRYRTPLGERILFENNNALV